MKEIRSWSIDCLIGLLAITCFAGPITNGIVETEIVQGPVVRSQIAWYSGTNNNAVTTTQTSSYYRGELKRVVFAPTSDTSTNIWIATLTDEAGVDVLAGKGTGSNALISYVPGIVITDGTTSNVVLFIINDKFNFSITNCGDSAGGDIFLYTR